MASENLVAMTEVVLAMGTPYVVVCWTGGDVEPGYTLGAVPTVEVGEVEGKRLANAFRSTGPTRCLVVGANAPAIWWAAEKLSGGEQSAGGPVSAWVGALVTADDTEDEAT